MIKSLMIKRNKSSELPFNGRTDRIIELFFERIKKRSSVSFCESEPDLELEILADESVPGQGFSISGDNRKMKILASSTEGLLGGLGHFLYTTKYYEDGICPTSFRGTSVPTSSLRGIQLDTHFCNYYHMAPARELMEYVFDLAFQGVNCLDVVFPLIDLLGWDDPEIDHITAQIKAICDAAEDIGISVGLEIVPNQDFVVPRSEFKASPNVEGVRKRGNNGNNMCPNKPGALKYIVDTYSHVVHFLHESGIDLDYICFWPYDEGGCGCEKCRPWGANGFLKAAKAIIDEVHKDFPAMKVILSTWLFDTPDDEGEWSGLAEKLENNGWVDYILADSHTDFPKYPLNHAIPGNLPLINYPEISMWALYPWGGYGANPLPKRFERLWRQVSHIAKGGIAYSEGIFDDINKMIVSRFYWNNETTAENSLREYVNYWAGPDVCDIVCEAINIIEDNHVKTAVGEGKVVAKDCNTHATTPEIYEDAMHAWELMQKANSMLPKWAADSWRWRILYLRAMFDELRFRRALEQMDHLAANATWTEVLHGSDEAKEGMRELIKIYHSNMDYDDSIHPMYHHVRPALDEL